MVLPITNPSDDSLIAEAVLRTEIQNLSDSLILFEQYRDYYEGDQALIYGTEKFRDTFGTAFTGFRDNWCSTVVDAVEDKLRLDGFDGGDTKVWEAFRANDIDEQQLDLHNGALVEGRSYVIVWPDPELGARIDWQPAQIVRVRYDDDDPRKVSWAIKRWVTPMGEVRVTIYKPNVIEKYIQVGWDTAASQQSGARSTVPNIGPANNLQRRNVPGEPWPLPNPFGEVPVVEFNNRNGSEIKNVIPQQDALNYVLMSQLVTGEYQAFRQLMIMASNDAPADGWVASPGNVWHFKPELGPDDKPYPFEVVQTIPSDPGTYVPVVEMYLQHIALTSKTPVRYFFQSSRGGRGDAPSGESLKVEDQPLLDKVANRQTTYGNSWYRVYRLVAKAVSKNFSLQVPYMEPVWKDPLSDYRASMISEAQAMMALGLPSEYVITKIGLKPEELDEAQAALAQAKAEQQAELERQERMSMAQSSGNPDDED